MESLKMHKYYILQNQCYQLTKYLLKSTFIHGEFTCSYNFFLFLILTNLVK